MQIEIEIPRPLLTWMLIAAAGGLIWWSQQPTGAVGATVIDDHGSPASGTMQDAQSSSSEAPVGGEDAADKLRQAEEDIKSGRAAQSLLQQKEELLRYELSVLQQEREALGQQIDPKLDEEFRQNAATLSALLHDERKGEQFLLESFNQLWDAEGRATALGQSYTGAAADVALTWPVEPTLGISAYFHDADYKKRFGFQHDAIDIPVLQGSIVRAAADGTVKDVVDNGLGFNYITIQHDGGVVTLYGHLSSFLVQSGQHVTAGQPIGHSGGRPGTPGAGFSTGEHLHFGVRVKGATTDPLPFLPTMPGIPAQSPH